MGKEIHTAEFSGDYTNHFHSGDLVFQTPDGKLAVWFMDGTVKGASVVLRQPSIMTGWRFAGVIPLGEDVSAVLLQQIRTGMIGASLMTGTHYLRSMVIQPCDQVETPGGRVGCLPSKVSLAEWLLVTHRISGDGLNELFFQNRSGQLLVWHLSSADSVNLALADAPMVPARSVAVVVDETSDHTFIASLVQTIRGNLLALNDSYTAYPSAFTPANFKDHLLHVGGMHDYDGLGISSLVAQTFDHRLVFLSPGTPGRSTIAGPYIIVKTLPLPDRWQLREVIQ